MAGPGWRLKTRRAGVESATETGRAVREKKRKHTDSKILQSQASVRPEKNLREGSALAQPEGSIKAT